jgi:hypothetical protein
MLVLSSSEGLHMQCKPVSCLAARTIQACSLGRKRERKRWGRNGKELAKSHTPYMHPPPSLPRSPPKSPPRSYPAPLLLSARSLPRSLPHSLPHSLLLLHPLRHSLPPLPHHYTLQRTPKAQQHAWSSCEARADGRVGSSWLPAVA